jgi:hypothetical protein
MFCKCKNKLINSTIFYFSINDLLISSLIQTKLYYSEVFDAIHPATTRYD